MAEDADDRRNFTFSQEDLTLLRAGLQLLEKEYAYDAHHSDDEAGQQMSDIMEQKVAGLILGIEAAFTGDTIARYLTYGLE